MDTVRSHNVSAYGYERETTPIFDQFSKEGVLFENATAPGCQAEEIGNFVLGNFFRQRHMAPQVVEIGIEQQILQYLALCL